MTRKEVKQCMKTCMTDSNCKNCQLRHEPGCVSTLITEAYKIIEKQDVTILDIVNSFADRVKYLYSQYEEVMPGLFSEDVDDIAKEILYKELNNEY